MNPVRRIRRIAAVLAGLAAGLVAFATPAFATPGPGSPLAPPVPPALEKGVLLQNPGAALSPAQVPPVIHTVTRTVVAGGMHGWQIALIAVGAALLAAAIAVLADRAWTTRRKPATAAA